MPHIFQTQIFFVMKASWYLLGALLWWWGSELSAQVVKGRVVDLAGRPLVGATAQWMGHTNLASADTTGTFALALPAAGGALWLEIRHLGYQPQRLCYGGEVWVEFRLEPIAAELAGYTLTGKALLHQQIDPLPPVAGTYIAAGKKSEVIPLAQLDVNLADKTGRQIFAKIPGVFVYDMDGSGNQVNIATRGLDPHRSWEYNLRLNGAMTNSDLYGYPASHYNAPLEAIERIEIIRGTAALQYGATFGGMVNYVTKTADTSRILGYEGIYNYGSYHSRSMYHAVGGRVGKLTYYAYDHRRAAAGYRDEAYTTSNSQFLALGYALSARWRVRAELAHSAYRYKIPGPLTDAQFQANPRQATRSRNYYSPDIWIPMLFVDGQLGPRTQLSIIANPLWGARNSVQFLGFANRPDLPDPQTGAYSARQVDIDRFNSFTAEARLRHQFFTGRLAHTLVGGVRIIDNDLNRLQIGRGTTGSNYDLTLTAPGYGRDLWYRTRNLAIFAEHLVQLNQRWLLSAGLRLEHGHTDMEGTIAYLPPEKVTNRILHRFPLLGLSSEYRLTSTVALYGGIAQAYRPVLFADIIPANALEKIDTNLLDAKGHNLELGLRGRWGKALQFDVSLFEVYYNNRVGSTLIQENGVAQVFKTNLGLSVTRGVESYLELRLFQTAQTRISVFSATAYLDARYRRGSVVVNGQSQSIAGNRVESTPRWISRNGLQVQVGRFSSALQYSYVDFSYSDAENTAIPSANGARGLVPGYGLWDGSATFRFGAGFSLRISGNNLTNTQYFTKRPTIYPGPGVWPSDGRTFALTVMVKL